MLTQYKRNTTLFCNWAVETYGITRERHIAQNGFDRVTLAQRYCDHLIVKGLSTATIHTYMAAVCKGLGISMTEISKPSRATTAKKKGITSTGKPVTASTQREKDLLRLAEIVVIRKEAFSKLTIGNLILDENGDHLIVQRDKAGKMSLELVLPHEVDFVKRMLSTNALGNPLKAGQRPFTPKELEHINFSNCRYKRAQELENHFDQVFNAWKKMPSNKPAERKARQTAREAAEMQRELWKDKLTHKFADAHPGAHAAIAKFRAELDNPSDYILRGINRQIAEQIGRPVSYDRVSLKIASVYALSHWSDDSTIRSYLCKKTI